MREQNETCNSSECVYDVICKACIANGFERMNETKRVDLCAYELRYNYTWLRMDLRRVARKKIVKRVDQILYAYKLSYII